MLSQELIITNIRAILLYDSSTFSVHSSFSPSLPCCELIYTLDGESSVTFSNRSATDSSDRIRFLPAGNRPTSSRYTVDVVTPGKCIDVYFDTIGDIPSEMINLDLSSSPTVRNMFLKMQKLWYSKHVGYYHKCMSLMYSVLSEIDQINSQYLPKEKYSVIKPAIDYIDEHFLSKNIDCTHLPTLCGVSYSYFKRLFILQFGTSPIKYITQKKISHACDLLILNKHSVSDIASLSGYGDVYYFSRIFKNTIGMSPSEYKKHFSAG